MQVDSLTGIFTDAFSAEEGLVSAVWKQAQQAYVLNKRNKRNKIEQNKNIYGQWNVVVRLIKWEKWKSQLNQAIAGPKIMALHYLEEEANNCSEEQQMVTSQPEGRDAS